MYANYKEWLMHLLITYGVGSPIPKKELIDPYKGTAFMAKHIEDKAPHEYYVVGKPKLTAKAFRFLEMENKAEQKGVT